MSRRAKWTLPLVFLFLLGLGACGAPKQAETKGPDQIGMDSMYNVETKQTLTLGMTRQAVEKLLGKGTEQTPLFGTPEEMVALQDNDALDAVKYISYGEGKQHIVVCYKEDTMLSLFTYMNNEIGNPKPSNWVLKNGVGYGDSLETIFEKLGEAEVTPLKTDRNAEEGGSTMYTPHASWVKPVSVSYAFDKEGKPMEAFENVAYQAFLVIDEEQDGLMYYGVAQM